MTYSYAHLFGLPVTALRFFTVYGPWGRPDMALFTFVDAIENDRPITLFGEGRMQRDFTYIDDNIDAVAALVDLVPKRNEGAAPWRVLNIAGGQPVPLMRFILRHRGRHRQARADRPSADAARRCRLDLRRCHRTAGAYGQDPHNPSGRGHHTLRCLVSRVDEKAGQLSARGKAIKSPTGTPACR